MFYPVGSKNISKFLAPLMKVAMTLNALVVVVIAITSTEVVRFTNRSTM